MQSFQGVNVENNVSDEALLYAIGAVWAMDSLYERYNRLLYSHGGRSPDG